MTESVTQRQTSSEATATEEASDGPSRLPILKTYKMYVGGKFPRTESGRYDSFLGPDGDPLANLCRASRKDFRDAVVAARSAWAGWANRSAYNRGQVLYRAAEMLEGRAEQFVAELVSQGDDPSKAREEVDAAIDRLVYYAGWTDKFQQVFSSVNPVSSSHFNFSLLEPMGVVAVFAPENTGLLGLVSVIAPIMAGGNVCVVLASPHRPLSAVTFGEVLNSSDVPGGVVNLLTGRRDELLEHFASHMDVNAFLYCGDESEMVTQAHELSADNVKRFVRENRTDWWSQESESPYAILNFQEVKTTWHPVGS